MERNLIFVKQECLHIGDLFDNKSVDEVISELHDIEQKLISESDPSVKYEYKFSVEPDYEYTEIYLNQYRYETDAEYQLRLEKNKKAKAKARAARERLKEKLRKELMATEAAEFAEYKRLQAKFEGKKD